MRGALCQLGEARTLQRQMAGDVDVRCPNLGASRQVGQRQRCVHVGHHQGLHPLLEPLLGLPQQVAQVAVLPQRMRCDWGWRCGGVGHAVFDQEN
jgi:hypothetical protein